MFLEEGVKAERYMQLFNGVWEPHVDEMPLVVRRSDFVQDGAPPHKASELRKLLEEVVPGRWIRHRGPTEWPPNSPDLTSSYIFLWGHMQTLVYHTCPRTTDIVKENTRGATTDNKT